MQFEEIYGVKVDVSIPEKDKKFYVEQWERWLKGEHGYVDYTTLERANLKTKYEHFLEGSGVGVPPDPFKPLCAQHRDADLEAIIEARNVLLPPGQRHELTVVATMAVPDFENITGIDPFICRLIVHYPEIDFKARIRIPEIKGVMRLNRPLKLSDEVMKQLQLPTTNIFKRKTGTRIKEVFDFEDGYRLEYIEPDQPVLA